MQTEVLKVKGMSSECCVDKIGAALKTINGVNDVDVSLTSRLATVKFDEQVTSRSELKAAVTSNGYSVEPEAHNDGGCCGGCGGQ